MRAGNTAQAGLDQDESDTCLLTGKPNAQVSERRQLAKKINEVIKARLVQMEGASAGSNRRTRWTTEKIAAGSSGALASHAGDAVVSGNVANAQAAARRSANDVSIFCLMSQLRLHDNHRS